MSDDDEMPEWVRSALEIEGISLAELAVVEPAQCPSCGHEDECSHGSYVFRSNGSYTCALCERLLHGSPIKDEPPRCAQCGRIWNEDS